MKIEKLPKAKWENIKREYLAGELSMREISRKYGVAVSSISDKARKENWKDIRDKISERAEQKMIQKTIDSKATTAELALKTIEVLMEKLALSAEMIQPGDTQAARQITQCMKDLKEMEVYGIKSSDEAAVKVDLLPELEEYTK